MATTCHAGRVAWLWPERVPRGDVTVLTGYAASVIDLVAWDITSRVTNGHHWPDGTPCPCGNVLVVNARRPGLADVVATLACVHVTRPDMKRVFQVRMHGYQQAAVDLMGWVWMVIHTITSALRGVPDVVLVRVDNLLDIVHSVPPGQREREMGRLLRWLAVIARECHVAVVIADPTRSWWMRCRTVRWVWTIDPATGPSGTYLVTPIRRPSTAHVDDLRLQLRDQPPYICWPDAGLTPV